MMRTTIGTIKAHYYSGKIETVLVDVPETIAQQVIADLDPLPQGSFYAYHADTFYNKGK